MSDFAVRVVQIKEILPHPNADRLEIAVIDGWQCVVAKGSFNQQDVAIYIPIDSVLPQKLESQLFPPESKIKLNNHRIRTIRIRGAVSQGMLLRYEDHLPPPPFIGFDCTKILGITKFEPPAPPPSMTGLMTKKRLCNPHFREFGGINNFKNFINLFVPQDDVVVSEKIHGTHWRGGWLPRHRPSNCVLQLIDKLIHPNQYEWVFGSNHVQLQNKPTATPRWLERLAKLINSKWLCKKLNLNLYYSAKGVGNVYQEVVDTYSLKERLRSFPGFIFFGEVYGDGIQKNYTYDAPKGTRKLIMFDIFNVTTRKFLPYDEACGVFRITNLPTVPLLYRGPYEYAIIKSLISGPSVLAPTQKVREGVVVKSSNEEFRSGERLMLKLINEEYYLGDNTDFH